MLLRRIALLACLISLSQGVKLVGVGVCGDNYEDGFITGQCYSRFDQQTSYGVFSIMTHEDTSQTGVRVQIFMSSDCAATTLDSDFTVPSGQCAPGIFGPNTFWVITDDICNDFADDAHPVRILDRYDYPVIGCPPVMANHTLSLDLCWPNESDDGNIDDFTQWSCDDVAQVANAHIFAASDATCSATALQSVSFPYGQCNDDTQENDSFSVTCSPYFCPVPPPPPSLDLAPVVISFGQCGRGYNRHMIEYKCYTLRSDVTFSQVAWVNRDDSGSFVSATLITFFGPDCDINAHFGGHNATLDVCSDGQDGPYSTVTATSCSEMVFGNTNKQQGYTQYGEFEFFPNDPTCSSSNSQGHFGFLSGLCIDQERDSSGMLMCTSSALQYLSFSDDQCGTYQGTPFDMPFGQCSSVDDDSEDDSEDGHIVPNCWSLMCEVPAPVPDVMCHDHDEVIAYFASMYGMDVDEEDACERFASSGMCNDGNYGVLVQMLCPISCGVYDKNDELVGYVTEYTSYSGEVNSCADAVNAMDGACFDKDYGSYLQALCPCSCNDQIMTFIAGKDDWKSTAKKTATSKTTAHQMMADAKGKFSKDQFKRLAEGKLGVKASDIQGSLHKITRDNQKSVDAEVKFGRTSRMLRLPNKRVR